jgi:hypothetical protein
MAQESSHVENKNKDIAHHFPGYHFKFIPQGQAVTQAYYMEILRLLHEDVRRERPEICSDDWILHHDNAPSHKELSVKLFMAKNRLQERTTPPPPFPLICL